MLWKATWERTADRVKAVRHNSSAGTSFFILAPKKHAACGDRAGNHCMRSSILGVVFHPRRCDLTAQHCHCVSSTLSYGSGSVYRALERSARPDEPGEF